MGFMSSRLADASQRCASRNLQVKAVFRVESRETSCDIDVVDSGAFLRVRGECVVASHARGPRVREPHLLPVSAAGDVV